MAQVKGQGDRRTLLKDLWDESTRSNIAPSSDLEWDPPTTTHPQVNSPMLAGFALYRLNIFSSQMLAVPSVGNHTRPSDGMRLQITTRTDSETSSASVTPLNTPTSQVSFCYDYSPEGTKRDDTPIFLPPEIMTADMEMERLVIL